MFNDYSWISSRTDRQIERMRDWLAGIKQLVVIELGVGSVIPTVRNQGERLQVPLIRINPREFIVRNRRCVGLKLGALDGLKIIATQL